jgi:hypothetical protein
MNLTTDNKCEKCGNITEERSYTFSDFYICNLCNVFKRKQKEHSTWCTNYNIIKVKKTSDNNTVHVYTQCTSCGYKENGPISKKEIDLDSLPLFNDDLLNSLTTDIYSEYNSIQTELDEKKRDDFFIKYNEYLKTDIWKSKRERVLKRDKNLCQACLKRKASEVHHLSYKHVFNEPLFELVSVCNICHKEITKLDTEKINRLS